MILNLGLFCAERFHCHFLLAINLSSFIKFYSTLHNKSIEVVTWWVGNGNRFDIIWGGVGGGSIVAEEKP